MTEPTGQGTGSSQNEPAGTGPPDPSSGTPSDSGERTDRTEDAGTGTAGTSRDHEHEGDTFPRTYVESLRRENQRYRERAQTNDQAMTKLRDLAMTRGTDGILADPEDLSFDPETMNNDDGYPDEAKIKEAAKDLVARKPHYGVRKPTGDIGQGSRRQQTEESLADILRRHA